MIFNSLTFAIFFAVVLGAYSVVGSWRARKGLLLVASYLFYAAWNPPFVLLIVLSTVVDFTLARWMVRVSSPTRRRWLLYASLTTNLGLLSYFKYGELMVSSTQVALAGVGVHWVPPEWNVVLPVGISFYTFQTLSYTIDVYRGRLEPKESLLDFALFVTFFPQLVAGPIVRAVDFLPQLVQPRRASANQLGWGLALMTIGMFEKVVIGDGLLAWVVEVTYDRWQVIGGVDAWVGTLAFTSQIFCDFAGYSTIAIGTALCFGFLLPDNFHFPYGARGFSDFWRRWHISLSSWLRDYLYISLGGNRRGPRRTQINLMITMLLGGLWHGASWRFLIWGALHGTYLMIERVFTRQFGSASWFHTWPAQLAGWFTTLVAVIFAWVFFRAPSFEAAFSLIGKMATLAPGQEHPVSTEAMVLVVAVTGALVTGQYAVRDTTLEGIVDRIPVVLRALILGGLMVAILLAPGNNHAFIYFQF